jgi:UDP-2,4-diacetamido-2,4,6-trideoxy-beta-L-altropyranose hydrolase
MPEALKRLVFRADGSATIGLGHVYRCLAISDMLNKTFEMCFAIFGGDEKVLKLISDFNISIIALDTQDDISFADVCDIVVLDGYWHTNAYIKKLRNLNLCVVEIDDLPKTSYISHLVINHALKPDYSQSQFSGGASLLVGSEFALLRKEFLVDSLPNFRELNRNVIMLSLGGADPHNYTCKLLAVLAKQKAIKIDEVNILLGAAYKHDLKALEDICRSGDFLCKIHRELTAQEIVNLFKETSVLLCPASTTVYEACAIGVPTIVFMTAANQINIYKGLVESGTVVSGGDLSTQSETELILKLQSCIGNRELLLQSSKLQHQLIDGKSGERIRENFLGLCR